MKYDLLASVADSVADTVNDIADNTGLPPWAIAVIAVAAVVIAAVIVIVVIAALRSRAKRAKADRAGASRWEAKNTHAALVGQSREEVARNAKAAQSLIDLYGDRMSAELREEVAALADKLTYLSPYDSQEVADCDKEIADLLDDCRVYLTKRTPDEASVRGALREIGEQLAEREREAGL